MERDLRLVWLYCVIEDAVRQILGETRLRSRGPTPALTDGEALTIEIFGETLGLNSDAAIWRYASDHLRDWFPGLGSEWNFVRRCANLSWLNVQDALFHPSGDWNAFDGLITLAALTSPPHRAGFREVTMSGVAVEDSLEL